MTAMQRALNLMTLMSSARVPCVVALRTKITAIPVWSLAVTVTLRTAIVDPARDRERVNRRSPRVSTRRRSAGRTGATTISIGRPRRRRYKTTPPYFCRRCTASGKSAFARCASNGIIGPRFHQVSSLNLNSSPGGSLCWTACSRRTHATCMGDTMFASGAHACLGWTRGRFRWWRKRTAKVSLNHITTHLRYHRLDVGMRILMCAQQRVILFHPRNFLLRLHDGLLQRYNLHAEPIGLLSTTSRCSLA